MEIAIGLIIILIFEYIGDFILQTRVIATTKSENLYSLRKHILILNGAVGIGAWIALAMIWDEGLAVAFMGAAVFSCINGVIHGIIDWNIWKGYKWIVARRFKDSRIRYARENAILKWKSNKMYAEDPWFYNTIGLDRLLHVSTIILLYFYFIRGL